jgi:hypothetical protein
MTVDENEAAVAAANSDKTRQVSMRASALALVLFAIVILISLFRWTLVEVLSPFIEPILEIAVGLAFAASLIWSAVHFFRTRKQNSANALLPIAVNITTLLIVVFVPFTRLTNQLNFRWHYAARMAVVSNVLNGLYEGAAQKGGGRGDLIAIPAEFPYLSNDGEILRLHRNDTTLIFFFDFRGILDSFAGFVYSSDDTPPRQGDFGGRFRDVERLRPNWFWATSTN